MMQFGKLSLLSLLFFCLSCFPVGAFGIENHGAHNLQVSFEKIFKAIGSNRLEIFCYPGESQNFLNVLKTVQLVVSVPHGNYEYYQGANSSMIKLLHTDSSWLNYNPWKPSSIKFELFQPSCVGIETAETFKASLKVRHLDIWRVLILATGMGLFLLAPLLASNTVFHYATGVSVGVCGSLLVMIFLIARLVPKKSGAFTVLIGGWGLVLYALQYMWKNCLNLVKEYQSVALGYVVLAGVISFAIVYRYGPIKDKRSLNLVQWALQLAGMLCIFFSSDCKEFTVAIMSILLAYYSIPLSWTCKWRTYWLKYFPPKAKLLTEDEYFEQSRIETTKALEDLRKYCNSPDCNAWKTMSRLSTPQRFAEFVGGDSHLKDDEILSYEVPEFDIDSHDELLTSDEDDI